MAAVSVDTCNSIFGQWSAQCEEMLHMKFPLHRACRDGDLEALSLLLQNCKSEEILIEDTYYGWTPAHWAAYFGKLDCLRRLVQARNQAECATTRFSQTPTHIAAFGGHPHCLLWLLQLGADPNAKDYLGETPFHKAVRTGSVECVSLLAAHGAKLDDVNSNGQKPAHLALTCGFQQIAEMMERLEQQQHHTNGFTNGHGNGIAVNGLVDNGRHINNSFKTSHAVSNGYYGFQPITNGHDYHVVNGDGHQNGKIVQNGLSHAQHLGPGDALLRNGISSNGTSTAGRKRVSEELEPCTAKRLRQEVKKKSTELKGDLRDECSEYASKKILPLKSFSKPKDCADEEWDLLLKQTHGCDAYLLGRSTSPEI